MYEYKGFFQVRKEYQPSALLKDKFVDIDLHAPQTPHPLDTSPLSCSDHVLTRDRSCHLILPAQFCDSLLLLSLLLLIHRWPRLIVLPCTPSTISIPTATPTSTCIHVSMPIRIRRRRLSLLYISILSHAIPISILVLVLVRILVSILVLILVLILVVVCEPCCLSFGFVFLVSVAVYWLVSFHDF